MRISACVITKNEEKNLERCLESIRSAASEIIVVDTGSTDGTVELAKNLGARVYYFAWTDDFSAARNYAISKAKGKWIIFLDADEYFTRESSKVLRNVIEQAEDFQADFITSSLTNYNSDSNQLQTVVRTVRIFKKHPHIYYTGKIHEMVDRHDRRRRVTEATKVTFIIHTGYTPCIVRDKQKSERNKALLFSELAAKPTDSTIHFYLSDAFMGEENYEQVISYARKAIEYNNNFIASLQPKAYLNIISALIKSKANYSELRCVLDEAIEKFPDLPDFYYWRAETNAIAGRNQDALFDYILGMEKLDASVNAETAVVFTLEKRLLDMGVLYYKTKQAEKCLKTLIECLKHDKYNFHALNFVVKILLKYETLASVQAFLDQLYDRKQLKDELYLLKAALLNQNPLLAKYYYNQIDESEKVFLRRQNATISLLEHDYDNAAVGFEEAVLCKQDKKTILLGIAAAIIADREDCLSVIAQAGGEDTELFARQLVETPPLEDLNKDLFFEFVQECLAAGIFNALNGKLPFLADVHFIKAIAEIAYSGEAYKEAAELYFQSIQMQKEMTEEESAALLYKMGACMYYLHNYEAAVQFMKDANSIKSDYYRTYEIGIDACRSIENWVDMAFFAKEGCKHFPESPFMVSALAEVTDNVNKAMKIGV